MCIVAAADVPRVLLSLCCSCVQGVINVGRWISAQPVPRALGMPYGVVVHRPLSTIKITALYVAKTYNAHPAQQ